MATTSPVVNPAVLNALTLQWNRDRADLDDQTNRYRINYNSAMDKMRRTYDDTGLKNREGFSDRGMLNSGPRLSTDTKLRDEYNRQQGEASTMFNTNLATIARRRLQGEQEYKNNSAMAVLGLASPA
jgi:hypothetical protein